MVQICVWFGRPLEKTRFVAKCKGKPWLGHIPDPGKRVHSHPCFLALFYYSLCCLFSSPFGSKNRQKDLRTQESSTPGNSGRASGEELVGIEPVIPGPSSRVPSQSLTLQLCHPELGLCPQMDDNSVLFLHQQFSPPSSQVPSLETSTTSWAK